MGFKSKTIVFLSAEFLIILLSAVFLLRPVFLQIRQISREIISEGEKISLAEKKIKASENSFNVLQDGAAQKMDGLFVDKSLPVGFIDFLEKTAEDAKASLEIFSISSLKEDEKKGKNTWPSLNFQIKNKGSFAGFSVFLSKLEAAPYLVEIKNLNIRRLGALGASEIEAALSFNVFTR